jgi:hypothetical protein
VLKAERGRERIEKCNMEKERGEEEGKGGS